MEEICNIVGSRIRFIRRQKGYTLNDFADAIHRGKSKISLQRHNHKSQQKPSQPTLKRRCFFVKSDAFLWPGFGKEWC